MIHTDLPQTPVGDKVQPILRWISELRRVLDTWMRHIHQNKQLRFFGPYTVTAGDVTAGAIEFDTNLHVITAYTFEFG